MTRALPIRGLAVALLTSSVVACADSPTLVSPDSPVPTSAKVNDNNGMQLFDVHFDDDNLCSSAGFSVSTHLSGFLKASVAMGKPGSGGRIVEVLPNGRISLSANGKTLDGKLGGSVHYVLDANGDLEKVIYNGMNGVFTLPGHGTLAMETGRLILDGNGNVLVEWGPHDVFGSSPDVARLCAALSP